MAALEIVKDGHPALKKSAKRIKSMGEDTQKLAEGMIETLRESGGVGLAANQVGVPVRMIAVMHDMDDIRIYVNPRITKFSDEKEYTDEGCLSFPMLYGKVGRSLKVTVCAQDVNMKNIKLDAEGFLARIFQHETDHLNGIVFTQRAEEGTLRILEFSEDDEDEESEDSGENAAADSEEKDTEAE